MGQNSIRDQKSGSSAGHNESIRLDSWKEIAAYLHRDARTVRRWERERRLPVHRVPGGERSGVFAYITELERWLRTADQTQEEPSLGPLTGTQRPHLQVMPSRTLGASTLVLDTISEPLQKEQVSSEFSEETNLGAHVLSSREKPFEMVADEEARPASPTATAIATQAEVPVPLVSPAPVESAILHAASSKRALYSMALLLIFAVTAGSVFAFVHYRRFHNPANANHAPSPEAQELYLRGRYFWNLRTEDSLNQAIDLFTQSIVNDPHYAPAYAGLADSYLLMRQYGHMPDSEAYPRALAAARQAVSLDVSSPDAHRSIAFILRFWNWDMASAEREYLRAIELDPKNSQSHHWYATALLSSGRVKEALTQIDLARSLEPQSAAVLADRGLILSYVTPELGTQALQQLAQVQPDFVSTHTYLSRVYLDSGDYSGFLKESRTSATLLHDGAKIASLDKARSEFEVRGPLAMLKTLASDYAHLTELGQVAPYTTARLFGLAGDSTQAIHYLQIACDRRDPGFLNVENDAAFRQVRSSPQYLTLLARRDVLPDGRRQPIARLDKLSLF